MTCRTITAGIRDGRNGVDGHFVQQQAWAAEVAFGSMLLKKSENALLRFFQKEAQLNFLAD